MNNLPSTKDIGLVGITPSSNSTIDAYDSRYFDNPELWAEEMLGVFLWSKQKEIINSVANNRKTVVKAAHDVGKTYIAAVAVLAFLMTRVPSKVITTAPTWRQVTNVLWREINHIFANYAGPKGFPGKPLKTSLDIDAEWFAMGISPKSDVNTQGFHQKNILVVVDEAPGVRREVINALDSLTTTAGARVLWIGNPLESGGHFYEAFSDPSWTKKKITAFDSPNFTGEAVPQELKDKLVSPIWVEEKKNEWGENHPLYVSRVLGEFPPAGDNQLITLSLCEESVNREVEHHEDDEVVMGIDVARLGRDRTVHTITKGLEMIHIESAEKTRITEVIGTSKILYEKFNVDLIRADGIGMGSGVVDQLFEDGFPIVDIQAASRNVLNPRKYYNVRTELWFLMEEWLHYGKLMDHEWLIRDLISQYYKPRADGLLIMALKDEVRKLTGASPDFGDSAIMSTPRKFGQVMGYSPGVVSNSSSHSSSDLESMIFDHFEYQ